MPCSFCNSRAHNITDCNNILIDIHYDRIKRIYINVLNQIYPNNIENYPEIGKSILERIFNVTILRAVGVQYCWGNARETKVQLITRIWNYFKSRIYYPPPLEGQLLLPDVIIDRTPSPALTRHNDIHTLSSMMPHYSFDIEVMNRELTRNNIIIRNFVFEEPVEEEEPPGLEEEDFMLEPIFRRYYIMPTFVIKDENEEDEENREKDCPICYESINCVDLIKLNCSHQFCGPCIATILERNNNNNIIPTCALCRASMTSFDIQNLEVYHLVANYCIDL
jgi:hypothetical protein